MPYMAVCLFAKIVPVNASESACGPLSLYWLLKHLGQSVSYTDVVERVGFAGKPVSMLELKSAAQTWGISLHGYRVSLDDFLRVELPAIAQLDDNHFVSIVGFSADSTVLVDPPDTIPTLVAVDDLRRRWSEAVLIVGESPGDVIREADCPQMAIEENVRYLGVVEPRSKISIAYGYRNVGIGELA